MASPTNEPRDYFVLGIPLAAEAWKRFDVPGLWSGPRPEPGRRSLALRALADRLKRDAADDPAVQVQRAFELCRGRQPSDDESRDCSDLIRRHGLAAFCRVLLNTSEMIYVL